MQSFCLDGGAGIRLWKTGNESFSNHRHLALSLLQIGVRLQACEDAQEARVSLRLGLGENERRPHFRFDGPKRWKLETFGHDSGDRVRLSIERQGRAYDVGVGAKLAVPELVSQNHDLAISGTKRASKRRGHFQKLEKARGNFEPVELLWVLAPLENGRPRCGGRHQLECRGLFAPSVEVARGRGGSRVAARDFIEKHSDEAIGMTVLKRAEEYRVDDGEDSARGGDTKRESQNARRGKARRFSQATKRHGRVEEESVPPARAWLLSLAAAARGPAEIGSGRKNVECRAADDIRASMRSLECHGERRLHLRALLASKLGGEAAK